MKTEDNNMSNNKEAIAALNAQKIPKYVAKPSDISLKAFKADILGIANSTTLSEDERNNRLKNYLQVSVRDMLRDWCKLYQFVDSPLLMHRGTVLQSPYSQIILDQYMFAPSMPITNSNLRDSPKLEIMALLKRNRFGKVTDVKLQTETYLPGKSLKSRAFAQPQTFINVVWKWLIDIRVQMCTIESRRALASFREELRRQEQVALEASKFCATPIEDSLK